MIEVTLAIGIGAMFSMGVYMTLRENFVRVIIGVILLSNSVNLLLLTMGRLTRDAEPLIPHDQHTLHELPANPLPQALILTAIVIGFGLLAFSLVLAIRAYQHHGTLSTDEMRVAEPKYSDEMTETDVKEQEAREKEEEHE